MSFVSWFEFYSWLGRMCPCRLQVSRKGGVPGGLGPHRVASPLTPPPKKMQKGKMRLFS